MSAQHAFCVKKRYWLPQIPWIVETRVGLPASDSSVVHANCSGLYVAALAGPPTEATQVGSAGLPLRKQNAIPSVIVSWPSPGA